MSAEPTLFKDIGDIIDEVAASDSTGVVSTAAAGQVAPPATGGEEEEEDSSEDEMEQGDPEAFVMNQVSV